MTGSPQRTQRARKIPKAFFPASSAPSAVALFALAFALAGCGGAPHRPALERDASVAAPKSSPPAAPRRGGYYQDDGPGDSPPPDMNAIADAEPRIEPLARAANNPYTVFGQRYVPFTSFQPYRERGVASWYGRKFHGQKTSSGEPYDMYAMTAAHTILPIPSYARVTNPANGRSVIVRVNDRGPFHSARVIDLSYTAAWKLGYAAAGSATVEVEAITPEEIPLIAARKNDGAPPVQIARAEPPVQPVETINAAPAEPPPAQASAPAIPIESAAGGVYLQLGAFSARDNAENLRAKIRQQLAWLDRAIEIIPKDGLFRLHLGPYRDRGEATGIAERIREALELKPMIVVR